MEKVVNAPEVPQSFGKMLQDIIDHGDKFVVEHQGAPVAAMVPVEVYEQWKQSRERFFETTRLMQTNSNMNAEEAEQLAAEAVKAARSK